MAVSLFFVFQWLNFVDIFQKKLINTIVFFDERMIVSKNVIYCPCVFSKSGP